MKPLRYDQPVTGDALILGARLPRREEIAPPPPAPIETSPGVFLAPDGKFFTSLETPKGVSPETWAQPSKLRGKRVHDSIIMDDLGHDDPDLRKFLDQALPCWSDIYAEFFHSNFASTPVRHVVEEAVSADFANLEARIAAVAAGVEHTHSGTVAGRMSSPSARGIFNTPKRAC